MRDAAGSVAGRIFAFRDVSRERGVEQMRSDFVSTVSHELRTPLTSIYGFAETLKRSDVDFSEAERETFLRYIASESERLIRIVDDLLDVARLEAGTLEVALEPTEVGRVAREAIAVASGRANGSRSFSLQIEPADLAVRADREKFAQVLDNLLDNAVRFSPEGGTISVVARGRRGAAEITVADEGVGIAEADRRRVFTKFFRAERDPAAPGAGLGLFLVRGLVAAMGGRIWVESEEGLGSRFTFELPLADGDPADEPAARGGRVVTRVLVIDDEAPIRLLCRVNLEAEGMDVSEAGDGPGGLGLARDRRPDVILLDVMMPGLDGWRVAEMLLDDPLTADIPIVFLTARADVRDRARGIDLGGLEYITKPFNPVELATLVRRVLAAVERGEREQLRSDKVAQLRELFEGVVAFERVAALAEAGDGHLDAAVAAPGAARPARPDEAEAGAQQERAVARAVQPHPHGLRRREPRAGPPREDLAHARAETAGVVEGVPPDQVPRPRVRARVQARPDPELPQPVGRARVVDPVDEPLLHRGRRRLGGPGGHRRHDDAAAEGEERSQVSQVSRHATQPAGPMSASGWESVSVL